MISIVFLHAAQRIAMQYFLRDSLQDMLFDNTMHKALWLLRGMAPCRASARSVVSVWSGIAWGAVSHRVVFCLPPYSPAARSVLCCLHFHVRRALSTTICLLVRQLLGTMSLQSMMEPGKGA